MLNRQPGFRLYPRGFIGGIQGPRVEKMVSPQVTAVTQHGQVRLNIANPRDPDLDANQDIELLFATYIKEAGDVLGFEFRTRVLKTALFAFGTPSFFVWFKEQSASPSCGELHRRFLIDTLNYINGNKREMSLGMWAELIELEEAVPPTSKFYEATETFFGCSARETIAKRNDSLVDVIQLWCARPNGIEDLLQTLHILFGNP